MLNMKRKRKKEYYQQAQRHAMHVIKKNRTSEPPFLRGVQGRKADDQTREPRVLMSCVPQNSFPTTNVYTT